MSLLERKKLYFQRIIQSMKVGCLKLVGAIHPNVSTEILHTD